MATIQGVVTACHHISTDFMFCLCFLLGSLSLKHCSCDWGCSIDKVWDLSCKRLRKLWAWSSYVLTGWTRPSTNAPEHLCMVMRGKDCWDRPCTFRRLNNLWGNLAEFEFLEHSVFKALILLIASGVPTQGLWQSSLVVWLDLLFCLSHTEIRMVWGQGTLAAKELYSQLHCVESDDVVAMFT